MACPLNFHGFAQSHARELDALGLRCSSLNWLFFKQRATAEMFKREFSICLFKGGSF